MAQFVRIFRLLPVRKHFSCCNLPNSWSKVALARFLSGQKQTPNVADDEISSFSHLTKLNIHVEIVQRIQSKHGTKYDFVLDHIKDATNFLITECEADLESVAQMFFQLPTLGDVSETKWRETVHFLREHGLPVSVVIDIARKCPQILRAKIAHMESCCEVLRQEYLAGPDVVHVLQSAPLLLVTDSNYTRRRIALLKTLFTQKDIFHMMTTSPNVMFDDWDDIEAKVQYVIHRMGLDQKQILESCLFIHSLRHIEMRHQLMTRTGSFKNVLPKQRVANPPLTKMVDTTDEKFAAIVGITLEEYEVFEKMFDLERESIEDDDGESSSSSDEEGDDK